MKASEFSEKVTWYRARVLTTIDRIDRECSGKRHILNYVYHGPKWMRYLDLFLSLRPSSRWTPIRGHLIVLEPLFGMVAEMQTLVNGLEEHSEDDISEDTVTGYKIMLSSNLRKACEWIVRHCQCNLYRVQTVDDVVKPLLDLAESLENEVKLSVRLS